MVRSLGEWRVVDHGSWPEDVPRPFFFLSYAHSPRVPRVTNGGPKTKTHWEEQLFHDLCEAVAEMAGLDDDEPAGFMDTGMHLGEGWSERITEALAHCRVFVPLYSPRYFRSEACGQEWAAFSSRQVLINRPGSSQISGVVPVQWVVVGQDDLPDVARPLQYAHRDFGEDYVTEGLLSLSRLSYFREQYELAVLRLAQTIVRVARQTTITVGRRRDFQTRASAFQPPDQRRRLRIAVMACDVRNLPVGRSADAYGISAVDWKPYRGVADTLARRAAYVARQSEFHPSIHEFEEEAQLLLRGEAPAAPGVLLLDRWSLLDKDRRELLKRFDAQNPTWVGVLEPWPEDDAECERRNEELLRLADETLTHMRVERRRRPGERANGALATVEDFEDSLPGAAMAAQHAFDLIREEGRTRPRGPRKPSLRTDPPDRPAPGDPPDHGDPPEPSGGPGEPSGPPKLPPQQEPPSSPPSGPGEDSRE
ncbi:FxsC protein [Streptacidiphilus pinicola]|uniref:FxsC protein n=1 Tax=Streptacidiphilus pinicola TaxID=2219663 RepID=A0A2X0KD18_9ACTN|nr:TIR-like protein FxsC [Streptacidiphilus pinicola]RAG86965.1 FxsC protein [Streptacidiphilus pinicola]